MPWGAHPQYPPTSAARGVPSPPAACSRSVWDSRSHAGSEEGNLTPQDRDELRHTGSVPAAELLGGKSLAEAHTHTHTLMLGTSSSLESLVRLSIRLFQSSRSTVLWVGSQVYTGDGVSTGSHPTSKPAASGTLTQLVCSESPWLPQQVNNGFWLSPLAAAHLPSVTVGLAQVPAPPPPPQHPTGCGQLTRSPPRSRP